MFSALMLRITTGQQTDEQGPADSSELLADAGSPAGGYEWELTVFMVGVFLQLLGLPFVAVSQVSLFSKVTAEKTQGAVCTSHTQRASAPLHTAPQVFMEA